MQRLVVFRERVAEKGKVKEEEAVLQKKDHRTCSGRPKGIFAYHGNVAAQADRAAQVGIGVVAKGIVVAALPPQQKS